MLEQHQVAPGREVAVLVEDSVVRQEAFPVDRFDLAGSADGAGVVEITIEPWHPDQRDDAPRLAGERLRLGLGRLHEARPQEQVLGRVARDRELGKDDEIGLLVLGLREPPANPLRVAVEVADDGVDLGEREPHR